MSERKQVRAATSQLASIVESADDAIIGMTLDGIILSWNLSAERIFGYTAEEVKGRPFSILIPPERADEVPRILERIKRGERVEHYETVRKRKDGTLLDVSITISPTRGETGKITGASTIASDNTSRIRAQQLLAQRSAELEAANKELEAFTYSVSHDLRAPLRHINGFSKILLEDFGPQMNPAAKEYLQRIHETAQYMGRLVDDLLHLGRVGRQELTLQITGLNALVEEAIVHLRSEAPDRQIDWRVGPLPYVECDPGLIEQVFVNLLSNALKFTRPRERAVIEVGQMKVEGQTVIFVRDNGIGFDVRYAEKMFGVFQRLHRREDFEGTGVGLAIVQRIIHKHAGRIWAEAELEKGATFYFTLVPPGQAKLETMSIQEGKTW
jgi:PAS domain S-box-containing protein